jgi:4-hydroxyphenylacetate 3-monooxygenase
MGLRTGKDYVEALRDGRQVWHAGERLRDVPAHPGFAGTVGTLARLYDLQHTPPYADTMAVDWGGQRIS